MSKTQRFLDIRPWVGEILQRLDALDEWQAIVQDLRRRYPGRKVLMNMLEAL